MRLGEGGGYRGGNFASSFGESCSAKREEEGEVIRAEPRGNAVCSKIFKASSTAPTSEGGASEQCTTSKDHAYSIKGVPVPHFTVS